MKFTSVLFAAAASVAMVGAAPHERAAHASFKASEIESWVLNAWGPQEPLSTKGDVIILDANLHSASTIKEQKQSGKKVVCYMSAGTIENWRSDADKYKQSASMGKKYKGFNEQWLDVTEWETAKPYMTARLDEAAAKGCDAVELDNIDCYDHGSACVPGASTDVLKEKEVEYIKWLSNYAHSKGLAVGLKNVNGIVDEVIDYGDFAIEEGNPASEFSKFGKFTDQNKLVVSVQYNDQNGDVCANAKEYKMLAKYQKNGWENC